MEKGVLVIRNVLIKSISFSILLLLYSSIAAAQDTTLLKIVHNITATTNNFPVEKLYVQTDKPSYNVGDTLWFKTYLFNAAYLKASSKSGLLYIEIADEHNQVIKRIMVSLYDGLGWGNIALTEKEFPQGEYTLRAYTNWMRNFGESCIFQRQFSINEFSNKAWLINARFNILPEGNRKNANASLHFNLVNGQSVLFRELEIALTNGSKVWNKNKFRTDVEGALDFNFKIPARADPHKLAITVKDLRKTEASRELTVPVILNRNIDLQFMPEGGNLVAGIKNRIAFKAISENGKGYDVFGIIYNKEHQVVDSFKSSHLGMGSFYLVPKAGEIYTAAIKLNDEIIISYPLPAIKNSGIGLHIVNLFKSDSIEVNIISHGLQNDTSHYYYLTGQARGIGCFGARVVLDKKIKTFRLSKDIFPTGISRFTLLSADKHPLCERIIFIDHHDRLHPRITYKKQYTKRDSVAMDIRMSDNEGAPVQGSFSVSVTDDAQVNIDTVKHNSLVSYMLLTSDIKGFVEDPGYYFPSIMTKKIWENLDDLLLTQGWVSYARDMVSKPGYALYRGEQSFSITGKVTNIFNKSVAKSKVVLFSKKPLSFEQTTTSKSGEFTFNNLYPIDTASYMIQARNKRGKSFNVGITINEFKPPVFKPLNRRIIPWYVNIDTGKLKAVHTQIAHKEEINKLLGKHVLREVVVVGRKAIKGSKNLNGPGGSDFALNQADMEKEGKATLGEILSQNVQGFRLGGKRLNLYVIYTELVHLIIDGVNLDFFKPDGMSYKDYYKQYLDYLTAKDIKGIEVMTSPRYSMTYFQKFLNPLDEPFENVFIEITTYSGNGAFLKKTPGVYLYKPPLAFDVPAQFYSPKYNVKTSRNFIDTRSTIYWQPNILTDKDGKAHILFYTADKPGSYTLIMEGSDMNGNIESIQRKIIVK